MRLSTAQGTGDAGAESPTFRLLLEGHRSRASSSGRNTERVDRPRAPECVTSIGLSLPSDTRVRGPCGRRYWRVPVARADVAAHVARAREGERERDRGSGLVASPRGFASGITTGMARMLRDLVVNGDSPGSMQYASNSQRVQLARLINCGFVHQASRSKRIDGDVAFSLGLVGETSSVAQAALPSRGREPTHFGPAGPHYVTRLRGYPDE